ncbi:HEAT repeat domain-containing protein [Flavobacteriaceae bacterium S356]|uniref:HEAT repeat domain-containing protein n=1 Tax=Asprobacillus argus TaxID=3076534 RepID=A0ABU3LBS7_9FLAO|nr:HEAT repeat domain-containing protein [Flavobacteriaceae bacterium S356]
MKCKDIQYQLADYLDKQLSKEENIAVEAHLEDCADCKKELQELEQLFTAISGEPKDQPSAKLRANFEQLLAEEKAALEPKVISIDRSTNWKSYLRVAASIFIVVSAFLLGRFADSEGKIDPNELRTAEVLAQFENQSASKRIQAVTTSEEEFTSKDTKIIEALIERLYFDKNTSVRLAAVEALSKFTSEEIVKTALIKSLETDKDPAIQIELIQILAKIQEKRALEPMKKLLENKDVPSYVKQELQSNLPNLL